MSYILSVLGITIFIISARLARRIKIPNSNLWVIPLILGGFGYITLDLAFSMNPVVKIMISGGFAISLWFISKNIDKVALLTYASFFLALVATLLILSRGVPILNPVFREESAVTPLRALFHGFAVFSAALLSIHQNRRYILGVFFLAFLGIISGFKSDAIAILISATIAGILVREVKTRDILAVFATILFILTIVSTYIARSSYGEWSIHPMLYIFYRMGFTFSVFDKIVAMSLPFGVTFGKALLSPSQEIISTVVLNYDTPHIITSSLFGPGTLDFGILGLILTACTIGALLGIFHEMIEKPVQACLYSIALTHAFILVEVGLQPTSFIFLFSLFYLAIEAREKE
jgi:hypothetical protein